MYCQYKYGKDSKFLHKMTYSQGCSANKKVWERNQNTILEQLQTHFKENMKEVWERRSQAFPPHYTPTYSNWNTANALFINIRFLFDLLVSENLNNLLLKLCEIILPGVHLLGLHPGVQPGFFKGVLKLWKQKALKRKNCLWLE